MTSGLVKRGVRMPAMDRQSLMLLAGFGLAALTNRARMATCATMPSPPQWMTLAEASTHVGLSQSFLRKMITAGKLPALKDGGWKVRRVDLANIDTLAGLAETGKNLSAAADQLRQVMRGRGRNGR